MLAHRPSERPLVTSRRQVSDRRPGTDRVHRVRQGLYRGTEGTAALSVPTPQSLVFVQVRGILRGERGTVGTETRNYDVEKRCVQMRARIQTHIYKYSS
jgi:hypothetical protein